MLLPYLRIVHVVRLDGSAQAVRNFLLYLSRYNNDPAATTWWTGGDDPTNDDITELYLMAREYEEPHSYDGGFEQVSRILAWMRERPMEVFAMVCRSRNIDWSLAERAILRFGDRVDADQGPIHAELDANDWLIHELSADNLELLGLATHMHRDYLEAYRSSHDYVWEVLQQTLLAYGQHNVATFLEGKMRTVLVVLADEFLRRAGNRRCAETDVDEVSSARQVFVNMHEHILRHIHSIGTGGRASPHSQHSSTHGRPSNTPEDVTGGSTSASASNSPGESSSSSSGSASSSSTGNASSSSSGNASRIGPTSSPSDEILAFNMEL
jgi:L-rhamnose mutarotase